MRRGVVLTDPIVARAKPRGGKETTLADARTPGLVLRVRAGGSKSWVLRRTVDGRQRRTVLGAAETMTVAEARAAARGVLAGGSTVDLRRRPAERFDAFAGRCRARMADVWKPSTLASFDGAIRNHLGPAFGGRPIDRIAAVDAARWFTEVSRDIPGGANRLLAVLHWMFGRARAWGVLGKGAPNPCALVRPNRRPPRWRILSLDELRRLGRALDALVETRPDESAAIRLLLLTGCRRGEILRLRWREVRDDRLELEDAKAGPRTVPLSDAAAALLRERRPEEARGYVFPHPADPRRPRPNLDAAWHAVRAAAVLHETLRLHDLRHTFASQAVMRGETLHMAGRLLGHRRTQTTERYAHLEDAFLLAAADRVSERVAWMLL